MITFHGGLGPTMKGPSQLELKKRRTQKNIENLLPSLSYNLLLYKLSLARDGPTELIQIKWPASELRPGPALDAAHPQR